MAREIRIERRGERPDGMTSRTHEPATTDEARRAIEETRGRISATLDEIEDRIGEARENIKDKVNVARPIRNRLRQNPLPGIGVAFGTGLVFGLLTGGGEKEGKKRGMLGDEEREELRRWREERRERLREMRHRGMGEAEGPSFIGQMAGALASAVIAGLLARARRTVAGERAPEHEEFRAAA